MAQNADRHGSGGPGAIRPGPGRYRPLAAALQRDVRPTGEDEDSAYHRGGLSLFDRPAPAPGSAPVPLEACGLAAPDACGQAAWPGNGSTRSREGVPGAKCLRPGASRGPVKRKPAALHPRQGGVHSARPRFSFPTAGAKPARREQTSWPRPRRPRNRDAPAELFPGRKMLRMPVPDPRPGALAVRVRRVSDG